MADFSLPCQKARQAYQQTLVDHKAAVQRRQRAHAKAKTAKADLDRKQAALTQAEVSMNQANQNWDGEVARIRTDPTLGVAEVQAGVLPQDPRPAEATGAGKFRARQIPAFSLWAKGGDQSLSHWLQQADLLMNRLNKLRDTAIAAAAEVARREAARDAGQVLHAAAKAKAKVATQEAEQVFEQTVEALAKIKRVCGKQRARHPFTGGGTIIIDPGVTPDNEKEVRDRLATLPKNETKGLKEIEMRNRSVPDPKNPNGVIAGRYGAGNIELNEFGHKEDTLKHEVGHHVYLHHFPEKVQLEWDAFFNAGDNGKKRPVGKMPTGYATTNPSEGFAEAYEFLRDNKPLDPDLKILLEKLLGEIK